MTLVNIPQLATQLSPLILPYIPHLLKGAKRAAEWTGEKLSEIDWDTALKIWDKLKPQVEKQPEVKQDLERVAEKTDDKRSETVLSWDLEKLLAALPPQQVNEIQNIITETKTEIRTTTASGERSVAIGGDASGSTISTGDTYGSSPAKSDIGSSEDENKE